MGSILGQKGWYSLVFEIF